jgi:hypothetical protein
MIILHTHNNNNNKKATKYIIILSFQFWDTTTRFVRRKKTNEGPCSFSHFICSLMNPNSPSAAIGSAYDIKETEKFAKISKPSKIKMKNSRVLTRDTNNIFN